MGSNNSNKIRRLILRLTLDEFIKLEKRLKASTCRTMSEYVRLVLFDRPVTVFYRNQSSDDLLSAMIDLKTELTRVGNNFNQAVRRLNSVDKSADFRGWFLAYEDDKNKLLQLTSDIKNEMQRIAEKWLQ